MGSTPEHDFQRFREAGDAEALGRVFDRLAPELLIVAAHVSRDASLAEDLVQGTFLHAMRAAPRYDPTRPLLPWLIGILVHLGLKEQARRRAPDPARVRNREPQQPPEAAEARELSDAFAQALADLPLPYRQTLTLRLAHGLTLTEIAHALGCPPGTVKTRLQRGMAMLRRALPAGCAGPLLLACLPTRGLAAMRQEIVRAAAPQWVGLNALGSVVTGALLMKKTTMAVLLALLVLGAAALGGLGLERWRAPAVGVLHGHDAGIASGSQAAVPSLLPEAAVAASKDARVELPASQQAQAATVPGSLRVQVIWAEDRGPVPGMHGYVSRPEATSSDPRDDLGAVTGADGSFRLADLSPGLVTVRLLQGGEPHEATIVAGQETAVLIELPVGIHVEGKVVDDVGQPVADAGIWLSRQRTMWGAVVARSDAQGRFVLHGLGDDRFLAAIAEGYRPSGFQSISGATGARRQVELVLPGAGGAVEGRVVDPDGRPIADAAITIQHRQAPPPCGAAADPDGRFRIAGLPTGEVPVQARAPGWAPALATVLLAPGRTSQVELALTRGATLTGTASDQDGKAIAGVTLDSWCEAARSSARGRTASDGTYRLTGLSLGAHRVQAVGPHGKAATEISLVAGQDLRWDVQLSSTHRAVHGRVVDERGVPLTGWTVGLSQPPVLHRGMWVHADGPRHDITDADGCFRVAGAPAGALRLTVSEPGGKGPPCHWLDGVVAPTEVVVRVPDPARSTAFVTGVLRDPQGRPFGSRRVWLSSAASHFMQLDGGRSEEGSGRFTMGPLPAGRYEVQIDWGQSLRQRLDDIDLLPGQRLDLGVLAMAAAGRLTVHARLADGGELRKPTFRLLDRFGRLLFTGTARDLELIPGDYVLLVGAEGAATSLQRFCIRADKATRLDVELGGGAQTPLAFGLPASATGWRTGALDLSVRDATGREVVFERLRRSGDGFEASYALVPGSHTVTARTDTGLTASGSLVVTGTSEQPVRTWELR